MSRGTAEQGLISLLRLAANESPHEKNIRALVSGLYEEHTRDTTPHADFEARALNAVIDYLASHRTIPEYGRVRSSAVLVLMEYGACPDDSPNLLPV